MLGYLAKLAAKNLLRQKKRTLMTFLTLSIGILSFINADSLLQGIDKMSTDNLVRLESGHVQVFPAEYLDERDELKLDYTFESTGVLSSLREIPGVSAVTPQLRFLARLNNGLDELPVAAVGIDTNTESDVFEISQYVDGTMPQAGQYQAVLGAPLAKLMELGVGDYFTLVFKTKAEAFQAIDLQITGLMNTPHPEINRGVIYLPIGLAAESLGIPGEVTNLVIRAESDRLADDVTKAADTIVKERGLRAYSWRHIAAEFLAISESKRLTNLIFLLLIFLIGTVGVINTILLSAMERVKEIGMMKAMGLKERQIVTEFALEALGIGVLGSLVGVLGGAAGNLYLVNVGIDFSELIGDMSIGYPVTGSVHGVWNTSTMLVSFLFGVGACLIASYLPARAAARKDPIQSLRRN